jgi:hypothetical protein
MLVVGFDQSAVRIQISVFWAVDLDRRQDTAPNMQPANSDGIFHFFSPRTGLNKKDIFSVVQSPRNMAYVSDTLQRMERGDLKASPKSQIQTPKSKVLAPKP